MRKQARPLPLPSVPLPLGARSVGHRREGPGYAQHPPPRDLIELFWCIDGAGEIEFDGTAHRIEAEQVALYLPMERHRCRTAGSAWEFRWMTADGACAAILWNSLRANRLPRRVGPCPTEDFRRLTAEIVDPSHAGQLAASSTAYRILLAASRPPDASARNDLVSRAIDMLQHRLHDPELSIQDCARRLAVNRSILSRRFRSEIGLSPSDFITTHRMRRAARLLLETELPVATVAERCGYQRGNYFARVFRRTFHESPGEFRRA